MVARKSSFWLEDVDGNVYLDFLSGMASVPFGASNPEILQPAIEAVGRVGNEDGHYLPTSLMIELAARLKRIAPQGLDRVDIALNGTEAVETAIRVMRRATGRPVILGFMGGYHGESGTAGTVGAEHSEITRGMRGLSVGFVHVPYPNPYRMPFSPPRAGGSGDAVVDYIRDYVLFHELDPNDVAGVIIEPVLGSGGVISPPPTFWPALDDLCREYGWLLCLDEVKTGFGRTGALFAADRFGISPDLMTLGKAMGGGVMPIGAVLGTERVLGSFSDVSTGSTWSWLAGACAAAIATIDILERPETLAHVRHLEEVAREVLGPVPSQIEAVGDVRVLGGFIAIELVLDRAEKTRAESLQTALASEALRRGVLGDPSTTSFNLQPSLITPEASLRRGLSIVIESLEDLTRRSH